MKLENQVCSLELAQKLKSLGVKQESVCWWARDWGSETGETFVTHDEARWDVIYAAFTVAELGEMLPWFVKEHDEMYWITLIKNGPSPVTGKTWNIEYATIENEERECKILGSDATADTEADARAKCLIYLLENKLITL